MTDLIMESASFFTAWRISIMVRVHQGWATAEGTYKEADIPYKVLDTLTKLDSVISKSVIIICKELIIK